MNIKETHFCWGWGGVLTPHWHQRTFFAAGVRGGGSLSLIFFWDNHLVNTYRVKEKTYFCKYIVCCKCIIVKGADLPTSCLFLWYIQPNLSIADKYKAPSVFQTKPATTGSQVNKTIVKASPNCKVKLVILSMFLIVSDAEDRCSDPPPSPLHHHRHPPLHSSHLLLHLLHHLGLWKGHLHSLWVTRVCPLNIFCHWWCRSSGICEYTCEIC